MSLFDGKPLTEEEIAARDMCECGHVRGHHIPDGDRTVCLAASCLCAKFTEGGDDEPMKR
jgi:hypothetical protein